MTTNKTNKECQCFIEHLNSKPHIGACFCKIEHTCHQQPEKEECVVCDPNWKGKEPLPLCEKHEKECLHPELSERTLETHHTCRHSDKYNYSCGKCIENLLLSERTALVEEIQNLTYHHNDEGVQEIENGIDYVKVSDLLDLLTKTK